MLFWIAKGTTRSNKMNFGMKHPLGAESTTEPDDLQSSALLLCCIYLLTDINPYNHFYDLKTMIVVVTFCAEMK